MSSCLSCRSEFLLVPSVEPLVWTSLQSCTKSGPVWFAGSTATVVDRNMGPEPGALRRGEERRELKHEDQMKGKRGGRQKRSEDERTQIKRKEQGKR